jgi:hypothetical protein
MRMYIFLAVLSKLPVDTLIYKVKGISITGNVHFSPKNLAISVFEVLVISLFFIWNYRIINILVMYFILDVGYALIGLYELEEGQNYEQSYAQVGEHVTTFRKMPYLLYRFPWLIVVPPILTVIIMIVISIIHNT